MSRPFLAIATEATVMRIMASILVYFKDRPIVEIIALILVILFVGIFLDMWLRQ